MTGGRGMELIFKEGAKRDCEHKFVATVGPGNP